MCTTLEVGRGEFDFSAAHTGLHDGEFESLHGHTFLVTLRLSGELDTEGMLIDFSKVKAALRTVIAPLHRRTLMPGRAPEVRIMRADDNLSIAVGDKTYLLPTDDVVVLPLVNTTTEAIARYLLDQVLAYLPGERLTAVELEVSEAPDKSAIARIDLTMVKHEIL
ncbi:MAG TPA: 6-carboxytetrahydropterin synthase [Pseudonocardiaceae bacterium]|nr:6-carboxytetrahydropterin synthase [Pseudonocardiaceae bacterium]